MSATQKSEVAAGTNGAPRPEPRRNDPETLAQQIVEKLTYSIGRSPSRARKYDWLRATTLVVRDRIMEHWFDSLDKAEDSGEKRVYYLSMEFLIGRLLRDAINNLQLNEPIREALSRYGVELDLIELLEPDAALGNGGLGRLAACFMELMASTGVPGLRLRHPLRPRLLPPGNRRRRAGGTARKLAGPRQSVGVRAARTPPTRSASAAR